MEVKVGISPEQVNAGHEAEVNVRVGPTESGTDPTAAVASGSPAAVLAAPVAQLPAPAPAVAPPLPQSGVADNPIGDVGGLLR